MSRPRSKANEVLRVERAADRAAAWRARRWAPCAAGTCSCRSANGGSPGVRPRSCPGPPAASGCPCRLRARVSIREMWLPRTTVRPRPSRSRPLGTCSSRNSSRSTNVRTARLPPPPTCPPSRMSAETPAMRRPQTPRYACQFGRLASTSSVGAWTPCAASSAAVDALGSDPSSAEHARPSYRTAASNRGEFDAVRGGRTVRPVPVREAWSTGAEVAAAPGQTRRPRRGADAPSTPAC